MKSKFRRFVARYILEPQVQELIKRYDLKVIAVGGSVGKTSTKHAIAAVLNQSELYKGKVLVHAGNYNSEISLPLSIFELPVPKTLVNPLVWLGIRRQMQRVIDTGIYPYKVLVLELGIDHPGEMANFLRYLEPDIGVVTAIAPEHMEYFKTLDVVAHEEFLLARKSKQAVLNMDDEQLQGLAVELKDPAIGYGDRGNVLFVGKTNKDLVGLGGKIRLPNDEVIEVQTKMIAEHSLYAVCAAAAVAHAMDVPGLEIARGIDGLAPTPGRMSPLTGLKDSLIIDDTYNSSPEAVLAALESMASFKGRKIAILGNMNELGETSESAHRLVGEACGGLDMLVTIGDMARDWLAPAAKVAGLKEDQIKSFLSPYEAGEFVRGILQKNDVVLVKGSQNKVYAEEAIKALLEDPKDASKLVRQSPEWMVKKKAQFGVQ